MCFDTLCVVNSCLLICIVCTNVTEEQCSNHTASRNFHPPMVAACPPACLTLSLILPLPSSPLQGTHMPVLQKKQVTLPEACEGFINVITVLTVSTSIHQFLFISMCLLIHSSRHVPSSQPEPTCWFLLSFVFSPREGLLRVHAHSHHNHVACQWYSCTCLNWRAAYCTAPLEQFAAHLCCLKASFDSCCGGSCFLSLYRNPSCYTIANSFFLVTVWLL